MPFGNLTNGERIFVCVSSLLQCLSCLCRWRENAWVHKHPPPLDSMWMTTSSRSVDALLAWTHANNTTPLCLQPECLKQPNLSPHVWFSSSSPHLSLSVTHTHTHNFSVKELGEFAECKKCNWFTGHQAASDVRFNGAVCEIQQRFGFLRIAGSYFLHHWGRKLQRHLFEPSLCVSFISAQSCW